MTVRNTLLISVLAFAGALRADHYSGGSITTRCTGGNFHEITLQLFRNCNGAQLIPQTLNLINDCGVEFSQTLTSPESVADATTLCVDALPNSSCNGGALVGFELATFRTTVYLSPCTGWRISWNICCRNSSLNVTSTPGMYLETVLNNPNGECSTSPTFDQDIIPTLCVGQEVNYDAGASSASAERISHHLINARFASPAPNPVVYEPGYSGALPYAGLSIDTITGVINFLPTVTGAVIVAVEVREFRGDALFRTVMRDFLFIVTNCANAIPGINSGAFGSTNGVATVSDDRTLLVCGEGSFCASLTFADTDDSQILALTSDIASNLPGATVTLTGNNPLLMELCWNSTGVAHGTYDFGVNVSDNACPSRGLQHYRYTIKIGDLPDAGVPASVQVCANGSTLTMLPELGGTPDAGGNWSHPDIGITSGEFTPGVSVPGTYTYTVSAANGCSASATLDIQVLSSTEPECIHASIPGSGAADVHCAVDISRAGRVMITSPRTSDLDLRLMAADGRLIVAERLHVEASAPTYLEAGPNTHGVCVLVLTESRTGLSHTVRLLL